MATPERSVDLGFVHLGEDRRPKDGSSYPVVSVASNQLIDLPCPANSVFRMLSIDLYSLYIDTLPDWSSSYEGLLKVTVDTRNPARPTEKHHGVSFVTRFCAQEHSYAPSLLYRGVFRNIVFKEWVNLRIDLFELDKDLNESYDKIRHLLENVPEIRSLDVLAGVPYLSVATKLFDGLVRMFGKNPDDHIWGEIPTLELDPIIGGACLRDGLYILFEQTNSDDAHIDPQRLQYCDGRLYCEDAHLPNHLIFGVRVRPFVKAD